jgi:hypothetical protein
MLGLFPMMRIFLLAALLLPTVADAGPIMPKYGRGDYCLFEAQLEKHLWLAVENPSGDWDRCQENWPSGGSPGYVFFNIKSNRYERPSDDGIVLCYYKKIKIWHDMSYPASTTRQGVDVYRISARCISDGPPETYKPAPWRETIELWWSKGTLYMRELYGPLGRAQ